MDLRFGCSAHDSQEGVLELKPWRLLGLSQVGVSTREIERESHSFVLPCRVGRWQSFPSGDLACRESQRTLPALATRVLMRFCIVKQERCCPAKSKSPWPLERNLCMQALKRHLNIVHMNTDKQTPHPDFRSPHFYSAPETHAQGHASQNTF